MAPLKPSGLSSHFSHPLKGVWEKWEIPQGPQSPEWEKWEKWEGVGMDPRRIAPATVGDGGDGLARTWLVLWPAIEPTPRKYQEPVTLERVLAEHRAAVAAVPIIEGMGTCAAPIEAPAGCAQAAEGHAALRVPRQEARSTGCSILDETKFSGSPDLLFIATELHENNQVEKPKFGRIGRSQFPVHTAPQTGPAMLPDLDADLKDRHP